jgi:predicted nucleotidyltransferase
MAEGSTVTDELLQQMTEAVVRTIEPEWVILFGSQAKGMARPNSDVDFLVVEAEPFGPKRSRRKEAAKVWRVLAQFGIPTDVLMYSLEEIAEWQNSPNHVIARALREGQVMYERSETGQNLTSGRIPRFAGLKGNAE